MVEAAQGCRQGVEGIAFLRHLSVSSPWTTHFSGGGWLKEMGLGRQSPSPAAAALLLLPAVRWPAGGVSGSLLLAGQPGTFPLRGSRYDPLVQFWQARVQPAMHTVPEILM